MESEIIEAVNSKGQVIGRVRRSTVYQKGILHKAVNIIVFNKDKELYIQQRSKTKTSFPFFWDISASEHVTIGETYKQAALRGLKEELSIKVKLRKIRGKHNQKSEFIKNGKKIIEDELVELFMCVYDGKIITNQKEVNTGKFVSLKTLKSKMKSKKIKLTPWALDELQFLIKNLKNLKHF